MERCTCKVVVLLIKPIVSRCRPVVGSIDVVDVNCQNWPIIGYTKTAYHLDGKPGNFGENSNGLFIPEEIFREKGNTFRGNTFFRFLPKRPKCSVPFVWITSARLQVERKRKVYQYFVNGTTQSRPCFRCQKNTSTIWRKFFTEISVQMVSTPKAGVPEWGTRLSQLSCGFRATFLNTLSPLSWSLEVARLKWIEKVGPRDLVILGVFFSGDILPFT